MLTAIVIGIYIGLVILGTAVIVLIDLDRHNHPHRWSWLIVPDPEEYR